MTATADDAAPDANDSVVGDLFQRRVITEIVNNHSINASVVGYLVQTRVITEIVIEAQRQMDSEEHL